MYVQTPGVPMKSLTVSSASKFTFCPVFPGTGLEKMPPGNDCVIMEMYFLVELKENGHF